MIYEQTPYLLQPPFETGGVLLLQTSFQDHKFGMHIFVKVDILGVIRPSKTSTTWLSPDYQRCYMCNKHTIIEANNIHALGFFQGSS